MRRRVLRVPDTGTVGRARVAVLAVAAAVVVAAVIGAVVATVPGLSGASPSAAAKHVGRRPALTPAQKRAQAADARASAANGAAAATWITAEVSDHAVIGCDPATCAAILAAGYASGGQVVLQPGVHLPPAGSVVVATPAVRAQYGAALATAAPEVIASFGTGPQSIQVRVVVPGGPAAYSATVSSDVAARRDAGLKLLGSPHVYVHPSARSPLTAGLVDLRLLAELQRLSARYQMNIAGFTDSGPAAGSSVPFRAAEVVGLTRRELAAIEKIVAAQPDSVRPALAVVHLAAGRFGLQMRFKAPSPG